MERCPPGAEAPASRRFPCLALAYEALERGDHYPAVLSAANEIAVEAFLQDALPFNRIAALVEGALDAFAPSGGEDLNSILAADAWARDWSRRRLSEFI